MSQANSNDSINSNLATGHPAATQAIDPAKLPMKYGMIVTGDCMAPEVVEGAALVFDRSAPLAAGDLVVLYFKLGSIETAPVVKRLIRPLAHFARFPYTPMEGDEVVPIVDVESINPPRRFVYAADELLAVHKCVGKYPKDPERRIGDRLKI